MHELSINKLRERWAEAWGHKPHVRVGRVMLEKSLTYKLQGALAPEQKVRLDQLIKEYKLLNQAPHKRGLKRQTHKNLLTGLIFDEYKNPYRPVFTNKKNKKYRYYLNQALAEDKSHPDQSRSRLPAHEIEALIEKAVRDEITKLSGEEDGAALEHLLKHHETIPAYDLVHQCVKRITVHFDYLVIKFKSDKFTKMVEKHLRVSVTGCADSFEITVPYRTKRGRNGSVLIRSEGQDIFDLSSEDLKRLVQGIVWRDEHFVGTYIKDIAKRENYSDRYVRNRIMSSFEILN